MVQLIILGYAGSESANFNIMLPHLNSDIILSAVEYKGRGRRRKEAYYECCREMTEDIAEQIRKIRIYEYPYAILGYSMGAQNVYELFARGLVSEMPMCIFIAAHEPPDTACTGKNFFLHDNDRFLEDMKIYGGLDEQLLQDSRFAEIYMTRMRADFKMLWEYCFGGTYYRFHSKLIVFYCEQDTPFKLIHGWQNFSAKEIRFYELGYSHFFYKTDTEKFCGIIEKELQETERELLSNGS